MRLDVQQREELGESRPKPWPSICDVAKVWLITETLDYVLQREVVLLCHTLNAELSGRNMPFKK